MASLLGKKVPRGCEVLTIDGISQNLQLLSVVQDLDPLSVGVVADREGPGDCGSKGPETKIRGLSEGYHFGRGYAGGAPSGFTLLQALELPRSAAQKLGQRCEIQLSEASWRSLCLFACVKARKATAYSIR